MSREEIQKRLDKSLGRSSSRGPLSQRSTKDLLGLVSPRADTVQSSYYMKALKYHLSVKNKTPVGKLYCSHFLQSIAAIKYIQTLRPISDEAIQKSRVNCARLNEEQIQSSLALVNSEKKTIVFDLEETLLHISLNTEGADMIVPVKKKDGPTSRVDYCD